MKLSQNEKLIEDNKNMIMYLNKNLNNTVTNPFKSRFSDNNNNNNNDLNLFTNSNTKSI